METKVDVILSHPDKYAVFNEQAAAYLHKLLMALKVISKWLYAL